MLWAWVALLLVLSVILPLYDFNGADYFLLPAPLAVVLGALIITRVPGNPVGRVMLLGGSAWLIYVAGRRYALLSLESGPYPGEYVAAWLGAWFGPLFLLSFPDMDEPGRCGRQAPVLAWAHGHVMREGCRAMAQLIGAR